MKITLARVLIAVFVVQAVVCMGQTAYGQEKAGEIVRIRGSESMTHLINVYAGEFKTGNSACNLVISGGDFTHELDTLINGETEIAMVSIHPSESEIKKAVDAGLDVKQAVVGWGGIVVIVHPSNTVESLTKEQLRKILSGEITDWSAVGGPAKPIMVVAINESVRTGTYKYLTEQFLKGNFAPAARLVGYFRSIAPTVSENEGAVGVIRMRNLERLKEHGQGKIVKALAIKKDEGSPAVVPTRESIDEGIYPITRPYFLYLAANKANKCSMDFFKFCLSRNPRPSDKAAEPIK